MSHCYYVLYLVMELGKSDEAQYQKLLLLSQKLYDIRKLHDGIIPAAPAVPFVLYETCTDQEPMEQPSQN